MTEQQHDLRVAKLFGNLKEDPGSGGLLLPEVFRGILEQLLGAGPAPAEVLHKIIRHQLGYKGERVLDQWGSWDAFYEDFLLILHHGGFITQDEENLWAATEKVIPGVALVIMKTRGREDRRRVRVTVHDTRDREAREAVAIAWQKAEEFTRFLEARAGLSPVIASAWVNSQAVAANLRNAVANPETIVPHEKRPVRGSAGRPRGDGRPQVSGQNAWYRAWVPTAGWHSQSDARAAWNALHPREELNSAQASAFRHEARIMIRQGAMERRDALRRNDRAGAFEYRWTGGRR